MPSLPPPLLPALLKCSLLPQACLNKALLLSWLPWWLRGKDYACNAVDTNLIKSARAPGEGNDNPFQYSCLGNPMDRGAWQRVGHHTTYRLNNSNNLSRFLGSNLYSQGSSMGNTVQECLYPTVLPSHFLCSLIKCCQGVKLKLD